MTQVEQLEPTAVTPLPVLDEPEAGGSVPVARRAWSAAWPKLAAIVIAVAIWQVVVWLRWRPAYVLPDPWTVLRSVGGLFGDPAFREGFLITARRAAIGFALSMVAGTAIGLLVAQFALLRKAIGSLITGLQTMPSIAWFPLAILLFKLSESAIIFVVVIGAAPAIANGLLSGVDHVPVLLRRAGRVLGANTFQLYRHVIVPAALPAYVSGLKQGWAFGWRSLMAGELLVIIGSQPSLGVRLVYARDLADAPLLIAIMVMILVIGIVVDSVFGAVERGLRHRRGLIDA